MRPRFSARARRALMAAVFEYLEASTPDQIRECLARRPVLLDEPADAVLRDFIDAARQEGRDDMVAKLTERRALLVRARESGNRGGLSVTPAGGGEGPARLPADLRLALAEMRRPGGDSDLPRRIGLLRQILACPELGQHAALRAALQGMLGASLASLNERTGSDDYEEAIEALESALTVHTRASAPGTWLVDTLNLGKFYARRGAGTRGENIETAIGCLSEVLGAGDGELPAAGRAEAQVELAAAYLERSAGRPSDNVEQAIVHCSAVLADRDPATGALDAAKARQLLGRAYLRRFDGQRATNIELAIEHLQAAASMFTREEFPDDWASLQCDLGTAYRERVLGTPAANLDRAIAHFQAVRESDARQRRPVTYAIASNGISAAYADRMNGDREHDPESAIACCIEARDILAGLGLTAERAAVQHNLGCAYAQRLAGSHAENIELAIGCLEDALTARTAEDAPLGWAETQHALGNAYLRRGRGDRAHNIEQAISAFDRARACFAELAATRQEAMTRHSLGQAYLSRVGNDRGASIARAISNLLAAEAVFAAQGMVAERAAALTGLGNACAERAAGGTGEAPDRAIGYHRQAVGILGDGTAQPALWAIAQNNLGTAYLERKGSARQASLTAAIACFEAALVAGATTRSPLQQAMTRHNLGLAYAERSGQDSADLHQAITHLTDALEIFRAAGLPEYCRGCAQALGDARARLGDRWPSALRAYETALDAADALYLSSIRREAMKAELAAASGLHLQAGFAAARAGRLNQAVAILERGRARVTGDALARDLAELGDIKKADGGLADAFTAAAADVRLLEEAEAQGARCARGRDASGITQSAWAAHRAGGGHDVRRSLEAARMRLTGVIDAIRRLDGHKRFLTQLEFADVAAVVTKAGPVAYVAVTDYGSVTLVVAAPPGDEPAGGRPGPAARPASEPAEPLTSEMLRSMLIREDEDGAVTGGYLPAQLEAATAAAFGKELDTLLPVLGDRLTGPLARHLTDIRAGTVTLVACGLLGLLPLHAASYRRDGETSRRCLLDDFTVSSIPSARVLDAALMRLSALSAMSAPGPVLAGFGNPDGTSALPFAEAELGQISKLFPEARTFYRAGATRAALIESVPGASHVHLACHGYFNAASPRESALGLARKAGVDPLTLGEIVTERRFAGTRLVSASACETAFIDFTELPDEVIGLPSGFLQAGSAGVIGTLWKVDDVSTALLMTRFYEYHLAGDGRHEMPMSPAVALRRAQLWLARISAAELERYYAQHDVLRGARATQARIPGTTGTPATGADGVTLRSWRPYAHPWHWAPFVFVGA